MSVVSGWVRQAAELPLGFAQVREDPLQDLDLVRTLDRPARVLLVASGGCTAAALAGEERVRALHLVDPNPHQLALARLKLRLLRLPVPERLQLLGHTPLPLATRADRLAGLLGELELPPNALGPTEVVARLGPDYAGRYERVFAALRASLRDQQFDVRALVELRSPPEQARRVAPSTALGQALDRAFAEVFALPNLVALFGEGATRNRAQPFDRHFAARARAVLESLPAAGNPWLWQVLVGRHPPGVHVPWLELPARERLPELSWEQASVEAALQAEGASFDLIHLSNVLDWLDPEPARALLARAWERLAPGGAVIVRQLNSTLDVRGLGERLEWDAEYSARLHEEDRSWFYRDLHVGRRAT